MDNSRPESPEATVPCARCSGSAIPGRNTTFLIVGSTSTALEHCDACSELMAMRTPAIDPVPSDVL